MIFLSDLFIANSSEPWRIPAAADLPRIEPHFWTVPPAEDEPFQPYARDDRLARPWAIPGTPGLQHRIGGLEKEDVTGQISYDGDNHQRMTDLRAAKVAGVEVPDLVVDGDADADLLVIGWGSSFGAIRAGVRRAREGGARVAVAHFHHLNPLPANTGEVLRRYQPRAAAGDEHRPARQGAARRVPRRRRDLHQGPRPAAVRRRDRAGDPGPCLTSP